MNTRPKNPANARNLNCCVIGSSGSGKTRFWLTPQLLQAHSSYVVVDPKGGIPCRTHGCQAGCGQTEAGKAEAAQEARPDQVGTADNTGAGMAGCPREDLSGGTGKRRDRGRPSDGTGRGVRAARHVPVYQAAAAHPPGPERPQMGKAGHQGQGRPATAQAGAGKPGTTAAP